MLGFSSHSSLVTHPLKMHPHRLSLLHLGALLLFSLACFLPGFSSLPPIDRDESRFAQASKQMLQSGDLVDIHFQDEARYKKPVGIYWLQAGSVKLLQTLTGKNLETTIWAYRLPSLIGAVLSVLLTALIGTRLFNARTGLVAGGFMAACLILNAESRMAKTDAMLLASILGCQLVLAKAFMRAGFAQALKAKDIVIFWVSLAVGILIKGPIIFLPLLGTLLGLKLFKEPLGWLKHLRPFIGIVILLALTAPWFILIMQKSHGAFLTQAAGDDLLSKIWQGQNWGGAPPGFYFATAWATLWPASLPLMLALPWVWRQRHLPVMRFLISWVVPGWLVFELTLTKLVHYTLPFFPALAIAAAAWLMRHDAQEDTPQGAARVWRWGVMGVWACVSLGLAIAPMLLPALAFGHIGLGQLFLVSLMLAGALAGLILLYQRQDRLAALPLIGAGGAFVIATLGLMLPNQTTLFLSPQIAARATPSSACPHVRVVTAGYNEPSLVFLAGADTAFVNAGEQVAAALNTAPCTLGVVSTENMEMFNKTLKAKLRTLPRETLSGFNYGNAQKRELTLIRAEGSQP